MSSTRPLWSTRGPTFTNSFAEPSKHFSIFILMTRVDVPFSSSLSFHYFHYLTYSVFSKLYRSARLRDGLRAAAQRFKREPSDTSAKSFRLRSKRTQSIDNETPVGPDSAKREYAIQRRVLEVPTLELSYYVDVVGVVPAMQGPVYNESCDIGNGDVSPEWGIDLVLHGGVLRYGPWADRQRYVSRLFSDCAHLERWLYRAELQRVFFPPTYNDADQTHRLLPGDNRLWTAMRIFVELRGGTTLHIPFREASKVTFSLKGHLRYSYHSRTRIGNGMDTSMFLDPARERPLLSVFEQATILPSLTWCQWSLMLKATNHYWRCIWTA